MAFRSRHLALATAATLSIAFANSAFAGDFSNSASYNTPIGMSAGEENQSVDPALRDQNGNLTVINGQITSAASAKAFASSGMGVTPSANLAGTGVAFGGATAIGNSLNVVTVGSNNTVVVNSTQTNNGNITATTTLNGH